MGSWASSGVLLGASSDVCLPSLIIGLFRDLVPLTFEEIRVKKSFAAVSLVAASALALAGCGAAPTASTTSGGSAAGGATSNYKACMVSDQGGFNDKSFNQTSHKGMLDAKAKFGIQTSEVESKDPKDFANNVQAMVDQKCNLIVTVGFTLADVTYDAAKKYPDTNFAIVDNAYDPAKNPPLKNLKSIIFNTAESSFEAGYVAAAMSKTGKVGTYGGMNIPTVNIFMDGYYQGVQYFNKQKGKDVKVLGWNPADPKGGLFVPGDVPFQNVTGGKQVAENLKSQGADIIFPVAGGAGEGALQVSKDSNGSINTIWVDTDGYVSQPKYASVILTSVNKSMDVAVLDTITGAKDGKFDNSPYVGTLKNEGTAIAPFHDFDAKVPAEVKSDLTKIKQDIIDGKIKIESTNQPK